MRTFLNKIKILVKNNVFKTVSLLCAATLLIVMSSVTYAWLTRNTEISNNVTVSDFEIQGYVYFLDSSSADNTLPLSEILEAVPYDEIGEETLFSVNLTDEAADNYIGNLRVVLKYSGASPAYVRARMLEQWTEDDVFIPSVFPEYSVPDNDSIFIYSDPEPEEGAMEESVVPSYNSPQGTGWYDNRMVDYCYYYNAPVYSNKPGGTVYMLVVNGLSDEALEKLDNIRNLVELNMLISVEACQPNRYREFFNLEALPWE